MGQVNLSSSITCQRNFSSDKLESLEDLGEGLIDSLFDGTRAERKVFYFIYLSRKDMEDRWNKCETKMSIGHSVPAVKCYILSDRGN